MTFRPPSPYELSELIRPALTAVPKRPLTSAEMTDAELGAHVDDIVLPS
jgi:hypothetical protein